MTSRIESSSRANDTTTGEVVGAIGLILLQLVVAFVFLVIVGILSFNSDSCFGSGACNQELATASIFLTPIAAGVIFLLSIVFTIVFTRRGRSVFLCPAIGNIAIVIVGVVAIVLNLTALT